jgi:hypothetical protein
VKKVGYYMSILGALPKIVGKRPTSGTSGQGAVSINQQFASSFCISLTVVQAFAVGQIVQFVSPADQVLPVAPSFLVFLQDVLGALPVD